VFATRGYCAFASNFASAPACFSCSEATSHRGLLIGLRQRVSTDAVLLRERGARDFMVRPQLRDLFLLTLHELRAIRGGVGRLESLESRRRLPVE
jgi:hypothetical protein